MKSIRTGLIELFGKAGIGFSEGGSAVSGASDCNFYLRDKSLYRDIACHGISGFMDGYVRRKWHSNNLDELFVRILGANAHQLLRDCPGLWWSLFWHHAWPSFLVSLGYNGQSRKRAQRAIASHYDIGYDFYQAMLGEPMIYSCAYWPGVNDLAAAQYQKLELLCHKLCLAPSMKVLDIGCGWGDTAAYMAKNYSVRVVGITLSEPQLIGAFKRHRALLNQGAVEFRQQDYRDIPPLEKYDAIVSVGMFEHVGYCNYPTYMRVVRDHLSSEGLFLLHTITTQQSSLADDSWIERNIFPNGKLPSREQIQAASAPFFQELHSQDIGAHYDPTLLAWYHNFSAAWDAKFKEEFERKYGIEGARNFRRTWELYLRSCAGAFRCGFNGVRQSVYAHKDWRGEYNFAGL